MNKEQEKTLIAGCLIILGVPVFLGVFIAASSLINAFVLLKLWAWFVVPTFAAPAITLPVAIGLGSIIGLLQHVQSQQEKEGEEPLAKWGRIFGHLIAKPALYLVVGYIASRFV